MLIQEKKKACSMDGKSKLEVEKVRAPIRTAL
jgi:hypothetical protein